MSPDPTNPVQAHSRQGMQDGERERPNERGENSMPPIRAQDPAGPITMCFTTTASKGA